MVGLQSTDGKHPRAGSGDGAPGANRDQTGAATVAPWAGSLLAAFRFLTVLPLGRATPSEAAGLGRSAAYFPLVGAGLGGLLAIADVVLAPIFALEVRAVLLLSLHVGLSGALHLDGLMDACDGLFGGRDPRHRLEIMRDSRLGTFGAVGGVGLLFLQFACLAEIDGPARPVALVGMATLGRWAMVYAAAAFPTARREGLGADFKGSVGTVEVLVATFSALIIVAAVAGGTGLALLGVALVVARLAAGFMLARVPGLTGDLYGAIHEVVVTAVLLFLAAAQTTGVSRVLA